MIEECGAGGIGVDSVNRDGKHGAALAASIGERALFVPTDISSADAVDGGVPDSEVIDPASQDQVELLTALLIPVCGILES